MKISIETVENGWIIEYTECSSDEDGKDIDIPRKEVIEDTHTLDEGSLEHNKAVQSLFWSIMEHLGLRGNKHNDYRTYIDIKDKNYKEVE